MSDQERLSQSERPLKGWRLAGTDKWWPAMYGSPPWDAAGGWEPIYQDKSPAPAVGASDELTPRGRSER